MWVRRHKSAARGVHLGARAGGRGRMVVWRGGDDGGVGICAQFSSRASGKARVTRVSRLLPQLSLSMVTCIVTVIYHSDECRDCHKHSDMYSNYHLTRWHAVTVMYKKVTYICVSLSMAASIRQTVVAACKHASGVIALSSMEGVSSMSRGASIPD